MCFCSCVWLCLSVYMCYTCIYELCLYDLVCVFCPWQRSSLCIYWTAQKALHEKGMRSFTETFSRALQGIMQLNPTDPDNKYHCLSTNIHHTQLKKATEDNHRWVFTRSSDTLKLRHMGPVTMVAIFCLFVSLGKAHNPTLYWDWN